MNKRASIVVSTFVFCCMALALAYGKDETQIKGLVTGRTSDNMTVKSADGTVHTVVLTDETKVEMPKGLGLRHTKVAWTELIPGLKVTVKGNENDQGQLVADKVGFSKQDLQTASMIQAGLAPTKRQVQTNQQNIGENQQAIAANKQQISTNEREVDKRFSELADYDVKADSNVYFASGSTKLSEKDKATLSQMAANASKLPTYLIQVKGYADSTGNAAQNQTLSRDRAEAVIDYLMQEGNITPRHIVAPGAMGISNPAASNETAQGRAENRRVEVKVMVNKGISGESAGMK